MEDNQVESTTMFAEKSRDSGVFLVLASVVVDVEPFWRGERSCNHGRASWSPT